MRFVRPASAASTVHASSDPRPGDVLIDA